MVVADERLLSHYVDVRRRAPDDRPWVLANFVATVDGSVSLEGRVGALSSADDRMLFHRLRGLADVVLVGAGTAGAENYGPVRMDAGTRELRRRQARPDVAPPVAVVSGSLSLSPDLPLLRSPDEARPIVLTCDASPPGRRQELGRTADVVTVGTERVDLAAALVELRRRGHELVTCDGGPSLVTEMLNLGLVDELCLTVAPRLGGDPVGLTTRLTRPVQLDLQHAIAGDGGEVFLRYLVDRQPA